MVIYWEMNSRGRLDHCDVVRQTILCSLIFTGLKMLRDNVLNTVISFFVVQTNYCVVECLDACGCRQIKFVEEQINAWGVHFFLNINVRVQFLHFSAAFSICSSCFSLQSFMLGLLLICASFDNVLLFLLRITGTLSDNTCYFILLMKSMIITRQEVPLVCFRWMKCFHTILGVSNSKYSIHATYAIQFIFPLFLTSTQITADTIWSCVQTNLFTNDELQFEEASYSKIHYHIVHKGNMHFWGK